MNLSTRYRNSVLMAVGEKVLTIFQSTGTPRGRLTTDYEESWPGFSRSIVHKLSEHALIRLVCFTIKIQIIFYELSRSRFSQYYPRD